LLGSCRVLILRYYPGIGLEGLRKTAQNLSHTSRSPGPRIEPGTSRIRSRGVNNLTTTFGQRMELAVYVSLSVRMIQLKNQLADVDEVCIEGTSSECSLDYFF
jgi:hypothetical protein